MKTKNITMLMLLVMLLTGASSLQAQFGWDTIANWYNGKSATEVEVVSTENGTEEVYEFKSTAKSEDEANPLQPSAMPTTAKFDYDVMAAEVGLKLYEKDSPFLRGSITKMAERLEQTFIREPKDGLRLFMTLERDRHGDAIILFDQHLSENVKFYILMSTPAVFAGKLLVDMKAKDFKGQWIMHSGDFRVNSDFLGRRNLTKAMVHGELIPLLYIRMILGYQNNDGQLLKERFGRLVTILKSLTTENLINLVIYSPSELKVRLGDDSSLCYGEVKKRNECDKDMAVDPLPIAELVGNVLLLVTPDDQVALLEHLTKKDKVSAQKVIKVLESKYKPVIGGILTALSDDVLEYVDESTFAYTLTGKEDPVEQVEQLLLEGGTSANNPKMIEAPKGDEHGHVGL